MIFLLPDPSKDLDPLPPRHMEEEEEILLEDSSSSSDGPPQQQQDQRQLPEPISVAMEIIKSQVRQLRRDPISVVEPVHQLHCVVSRVQAIHRERIHLREGITPEMAIRNHLRRSLPYRVPNILRSNTMNMARRPSSAISPRLQGPDGQHIRLNIHGQREQPPNGQQQQQPPNSQQQQQPHNGQQQQEPPNGQ